MNKQFFISVAVMFVVSMLTGFVVHGLLLEPDYVQLPTLFRGHQDQGMHFLFMLLAHVFFVIGFVWIYLRGKENKPFLAQGVRYGIAVALLVTVSTYLIYYAVQPMPGALVIKQIVLDSIRIVVMGIVVAWLNK
jgi:hypothetical protein